MAEFITGPKITSTIEEIFREAEEWILICSPYIKLHPHIKATLKKLQSKESCKLTIVFGKNENDLTQSINREDFEFFKTLPNVEVKHEPRLHAKYYASEQKAFLSSMNLYDFSHNNNIEFGVLTKYNALKRLGRNLGTNEDLDYTAEEFFKDVEKEARTVYLAEPEFKKSLAGLKKNYIQSHVQVDELSELFEKPKMSGYQKFSRQNSGGTSNRKKKEVLQGYCIRTGEPIPFNIERPMSDKAFQTWSKFGDKDYEEKFCHYSGEPSNGETSFARPIMRKYWKKAQAIK